MTGPSESEVNGRLVLLKFVRECFFYLAGCFAATGIVCHYFV